MNGQDIFNYKTNNTKIDSYLQKARQLNSRNPASSIDYIDSALNFARQNKIDTLKIFLEKGFYTYQKGNYAQAATIYNECIEGFHISTNDYWLAISKLRASYAHARMSDYSRANKLAMEALGYFEQSHDSMNIAYSYNILGVIVRMQHNFDKSDEYFNKMLALRLKESPRVNYYALENLGISLCMEGEFALAIPFFEKAEQFCLQMNDTIALANFYTNWGNIYYDLDSLDKSLEYYLKNKDLIFGLGLKNELADNYLNIGNIYLSLADYNQALSYYQKSLELSSEINDKGNLKALYYNLAMVYEEKGDIKKSYDLMLKRDKILKELFNEKNSRQIEELHTIYEVEKKEHQIAALAKENELKDLRNRQKNFIMAFLGLVVLIVGLAYWVYRQRQTHKHLLAEQEIEKSKQKLVNVIKDHEIEIVETALLSQNKERKRIAKDIHDRLGLLLATIKLHFDSLNSLFSAKPEELKKFNTVNTLIDQACSDLRTIAHDIDSGNLSKFGLLHALGDLTKTIESANKTRFEIQEFGLDKKLKNTAEIEIYRVIQELTTNIIKHSNATEVVIQFTRHENNLNILIEDNGIGFDLTKEMNKGMGLKNLYSRIDKLNGTLNIDSKPGQGTTVIIELTNVFKND